VSSALSIKQPRAGEWLHMSGVDWRTYSRLLRAFEPCRNVRLTYDRGELEIMSPTLKHDYKGRFLGDLVIALTEELELPRLRGGSATLRRRKHEKGVEADECFWIANAHRMTGREELDLRRDPPPDLAIEIDVTSSSLDRMAIYAALKVPELWPLDGDVLTFHVLGQDGNYQVAATSFAFPLVTPADLLVFLQQARQFGDENAVLRQFREWIRQRIAGQPPSP